MDDIFYNCFFNEGRQAARHHSSALCGTCHMERENSRAMVKSHPQKPTNLAAH